MHEGLFLLPVASRRCYRTLRCRHSWWRRCSGFCQRLGSAEDDCMEFTGAPEKYGCLPRWVKYGCWVFGGVNVVLTLCIVVDAWILACLCLI